MRFPAKDFLTSTCRLKLLSVSVITRHAGADGVGDEMCLACPEGPPFSAPLGNERAQMPKFPWATKTRTTLSKLIKLILGISHPKLKSVL